MHKVFLMNTFESFNDFDYNFHSLVQCECFSIKFSLISEKISHLAILHDDDYKIGR